MKCTLAILALSVTAAGAFQAPAPLRTVSSSALGMGGFLEGRGNKITIRDDEDSAMYFDDGSGGRTPSEKKPAPKKPVKAEPKKSGGFKFPWDKSE
mmetsp:Transcript_7265/g.16507  ORF Transcript_7265/g.16507 Transcript_7265/m.16507 type:complete len:96 (-) Transcript_7265:390-677(-)